MNEYVIFTDSGCDIAPATLQEWGVHFCSLTFRFEGEGKEYTNDEMPIKDFYANMREGKVAKTAAVNVAVFEKAFEEVLKEGKDILYLGFSSGLSTTFNSARLAAENLREKYPDRRIRTVDTLAASAGQGLVLYLTLKEKEKGATLGEAYTFAKKLSPKISHWFTVDDLVYLKRGGRVSPTVAFVGNLIGIKPVLHVDDAGHLVNVTKVRGRRASIAAMAQKYTELAETPEEGTVFISHSDAYDDAVLLSDMIEKAHGVKTEIITDVGAVIGSHSGPGTLALFFVAKER